MSRRPEGAQNRVAVPLGQEELIRRFWNRFEHLPDASTWRSSNMPNFEETPEVDPQHFGGVDDPVWNENSSGHAGKIQEVLLRRQRCLEYKSGRASRGQFTDTTGWTNSVHFYEINI